MLNLNPDFKEFIELLNTHNVEYIVVGGYAVAFHGRLGSLELLTFGLLYLQKTRRASGRCLTNLGLVDCL